MNRKQKRAQANATVPLQTPPSTERDPRVRTLYEIAAEKQAELLPRLKNAPTDDTTSLPKNIVNVKISPDGKIIEEETTSNQDTNSDPVSPILDTLLFALSLSAIHFTLDTLTVHQYAQSLDFTLIARRTLLSAFPSLFFLVHFFHGHLFPSSLSSWLPPRSRETIVALTQLVYLGVANVAGCYLIRLTNDEGYYAVMKRAPGIGTLWVWAVLELGLVGALGGVVGPGVYAWWNGYGVM